MFIEDYIPYGHKNRIDRISLEIKTGYSDRKNRQLMAEALLERNAVIINVDNAYFRPDGSPEDNLKLRAYYKRECKRTSSCSKRCRIIKSILPKEPKSDLEKNQLSIDDWLRQMAKKP